MAEDRDWKPVPTITITIEKMGLDDFAALAPLLQQWAEQSGGKVVIGAGGTPAASPKANQAKWAGDPASGRQRELLDRLMDSSGYSAADLQTMLEEEGGSTYAEITKAQASALIKKLTP